MMLIDPFRLGQQHYPAWGAPRTTGGMMPDFNLPLSGNVSQSINPWTAFFSPIGNQFTLFSVNLGTSSAPDIERQVLSDAGSYGKQLGRIGDALIVLLDHVKLEGLSGAELEAIRDLKIMLHDVANIKERNGAKHVLRPAATEV